MKRGQTAGLDPSSIRVALLSLAAAVAWGAPARGDDEASAATSEGESAAARSEPQRYRLQPPFEDPNFRLSKYGPDRPQEKAYFIALGEVVGVDLLVWTFDKVNGKPYVDVSLDTWAENFKKGFIVDTDDFWANSFSHPIHGSFTYTAARSLGLSFYESFGYSFTGSLLWELFGEIQPPSFNDMVNTPFGGSLLGEVQFRLHHLILDAAGDFPSGWRRFFAFLVSPMAGFNELVFEDRYRGPALLPRSWVGEFDFGSVIGGSSRDDRTGSTKRDVGPWAAVRARVLYGVPGTPDLELRKPFDHFEFSFLVAFTDTIHPTMSLLMNGLLLGEAIGSGGDFGGLWGLFTSYDFIAPEVFRAQGFGVGPGVSLMRRWDWFELHGKAELEWLPWTGAGSVTPLGARDYHYGTGGKGMIGLEAHFADRGTLRAELREYLSAGTYARGESENISYGQLRGTYRIVGPHAVSVEGTWSRRAATYSQGDIRQGGTALSAYYTLLSGW